LEGIPPAPRGIPQIEVGFDIDANGILHVSAKDLGTGKEQKIRIESSSGLTEDEIKRMVNDAETHADEDKRKKEEISIKNEADALVYATEKSVREYGDKVSSEEKVKIEDAVTDLKKAIESGSIEDIRAKKEILERASQKLGQAIYEDVAKKQQQAQSSGTQGADSHAGPQPESGPSPSGQSKKSGEDVVDAEFTVDGDK